MHTYLVVFYGAALLALLLTPVVVRLARVAGAVDEPGVRKIHAAAIPRVGGLAVVIPSLVMTLPVFWLNNRIGLEFRDLHTQLIVLLATSLLIFFVGLCDDIWGLRAINKFVAEIVAGVALFASGVSIDGISLSPSMHINLAWFAFPITLLWIVGITNAVNLIDGLDGLAAGISLITCTVICAVAVYMERPVMAVIMLGLIGSLIGFLFYNFNPAKIFLGDCGSLFLGFVLAASSIITSHKTSTLVALAMPVLALGIPIFDTLFSMTRRLIDRRSVFAPDKEHIHHKLLSRGLDHRTVVLVLYGVTATACGLGLLMIFAQDIVQVLMFGGAIIFLVFVFRYSGVVSLSETVVGLRRNQLLVRELKLERQRFDSAKQRLRETSSFLEWWSVLCEAANGMGFANLSVEPLVAGLPITRSEWISGTTVQPTDGRAVTLKFTLHDRSGSPVSAVSGVIARGSSFESVGRRASLFGRLLDEFGVEQFLSDSTPRGAVPRVADILVARGSAPGESL